MYLFPVSVVNPGINCGEHVFFFLLLGVPARGDEEMVGDRETRQPGGEFESTA